MLQEVHSRGSTDAGIYQHPAFKIDETQLDKLLSEVTKVEEFLESGQTPGTLVSPFILHSYCDRERESETKATSTVSSRLEIESLNHSH